MSCHTSSIVGDRPPSKVEDLLMSAPAFARASGSYRAPRGIVAGLLDGITLDDEQEARAQAIIGEAVEAQLLVTLRNGDGWARLLELQTQRDRSLRALLTTDADRALFDTHSAELRRRQADLRPTTATAPVVLRAGVAPILGGALEIVFRADGMADDAMESASWQIVHAFRADAEQIGVPRMTIIADILERRDQFATYTKSVKRSFGRQPDGAWVQLPAS
jgi:hypothetical protein